MMTKKIECRLCAGQASAFIESLGRQYFRCPNCYAILLAPSQYVSPADEQYRYETHNNNVHDAGYQQFLQPLVDAVQRRYNADTHGLDYGSGTGPVASHLLQSDGYETTCYDPFFTPNPAAFYRSYDYIIASEVVEHFHHPAKEFRLLQSLLKPGGHLFCMTLRYEPSIEFDRWHYMHDETHVIFYQKETARYLKERLHFASVDFSKRIFTLRKKD